jgi:hypothetical protein
MDPLLGLVVESLVPLVVPAPAAPELPLSLVLPL